MSGHTNDVLLESLRRLRTDMSDPQRLAILEPLGLVDEWATVDTPIGPAIVAFNRRGISFLRLATEPAEFATVFRQRFGARPLRPGNRPPGLSRALATGRGRAVPVDLRSATPFQRDVLTAIREIPAGEVRPYTWVATKIGRPKAVRAVGTALAGNPVPVLLPCHRVIRSDGEVGDYVFGRKSKNALLRQEGTNLEQVAECHKRGFSFVASTTTRIFCHPSCHSARRISDARRVLLADARSATERGFRPCRKCQPVPLGAS